jgi:hypothetical protein
MLTVSNECRNSLNIDISIMDRLSELCTERKESVRPEQRSMRYRNNYKQPLMSARRTATRNNIEVRNKTTMDDWAI